MFELVQSLGYVVPGSVYEEHIDDLSQFVTISSRIQLLHDAAQIRKEVRDGTAKPGLTLSCKSTLLATGEDDRWPPRGRRSSHVSRSSRHRSRDRNCSWEKKMRVKPMETRLERQAKGEESQPLMQDESGCAKAHDDGHSSCSSLRSHCTGSFHRTGQRDAQKSVNGCGDEQNPA